MLPFKKFFITLFLLILFVDLCRFLFEWPDFIEENPAPVFSNFAAGPERKKEFFNYFEPIVRAENRRISEERKEISSILQHLSNSTHKSLSRGQIKTLQNLASKYQLDEFNHLVPKHRDKLLRRVDIIPVALALAQAANESAWGTSRFATKANNYFGHWCFVKGCGLVPQNRDKGKTHEVAKFSSARESVQKYMLNLNSHYAYKVLRDIRATLRAQKKSVSGVALLPALLKYSERGQAYIDELNEMIHYNKLDQFDNNNSA